MRQRLARLTLAALAAPLMLSACGGAQHVAEPLDVTVSLAESGAVVVTGLPANLWERGHRLVVQGEPGEGHRALMIEPVPPDSTARIGKGLGNALRGAGAEYDRAVAAGGRLVVVQLDVGAGNGVQAGDVYQLLGPAIVDPQTRTLTGFERKALCRVAEGEVTAETAGCALDRVEFTGYTRDDWIAGGRVRLDVDTRAELRCPTR